ncbi:MAG: LacI family DNA-binding transcriptional regulator [Phycisphaerae bacterium]
MPDASDKPSISAPLAQEPVRGHVSIDDVASAAGVSTATVSRVLNRLPTVAPATADRVRTVMAQLGYQPNPLARGLGSGKSRVLGLALPRFHGEFMSFLLDGADEEATALGYHLMTTTIVREGSGQPGSRVAGSGLVEGMLVVVTDIGDSYADEARAAGLPVVVLDTDLTEKGLDSAVLDNEKGTREAVEHLLRWTPAASIFFVGGPHGNFDTQQRAQAFRRTLSTHGAAVAEGQVSFADYSLEWGKEWLLRAVQRGTLFRSDSSDKCAAVLAANDKIACGIIHGAKEVGVQVPEQLRVVGFNDSLIARIVQPRLSTVSLPMAELGATAVRMLVRRMEHPSAEPVCRRLPTSLVIRESSTAIRF